MKRMEWILTLLYLLEKLAILIISNIYPSPRRELLLRAYEIVEHIRDIPYDQVRLLEINDKFAYHRLSMPIGYTCKENIYYFDLLIILFRLCYRKLEMKHCRYSVKHFYQKNQAIRDIDYLINQYVNIAGENSRFMRELGFLRDNYKDL